MSTADEYRQYADGCLRSARDAKTREVTTTFLNMAQTWRQAALRIESSFVRSVQTPRDRISPALQRVVH